MRKSATGSAGRVYFLVFFFSLMLILIRHMTSRSYLTALYKATPAGESDADAENRFSPANMPTVRVNAPRQPNHCDCGVYLLQYAEKFLAAVRLFLLVGRAGRVLTLALFF
jgi:hypothetical protein